MADMTFEKIVEKTKRMLGKNYKGDKEILPAYSDLVSIEGHPDIFLAISNGGFNDEEVALIQEKTKNYSWWIANHGYLIDDTQQEIPALFIFGSEVGELIPDVLNFNGAINNNFYLPINRTNIAGDVNISSNHMYVQFVLDEKIKSYEFDTDGIIDTLELEGINYKYYAGRLYPEDKIILDNNIIYPIYLVSNLEYYRIPLDEEAENLNGTHDFELTEKNNLEILEDVCEMVIHEAAQWTNRNVDVNLLNEGWPIIVKCACMAYLNRGSEGLGSQSELGQQNVYNDWVTMMHRQITNRRYIL